MIKNFLFLFFITFSLQALESIRCYYPVGTIGSDLLFLDQQSLQSLHLWKYSPQACTSDQALLFIYSPSAISVLPSENGFSFVDRGMIRVKKFLKRSPQTIGFFDPIYNITRVGWLDDETCYFSAKQDERYKIFISDLDGELTTVADQPDADLIYPSLINDSLYYLKKGIREDIALCRIEINEYLPQTLVSLGKKNASFLQMISDFEGFFVETPFSIDSESENLSLRYNHLFFKDGSWGIETLFSFTIPMHYLFGRGPERFYESLLPFVPKVYDNEILFSSLTNKYLDIYSFDRTEKEIALLLSNTVETDRFSAMRHQGKIYYGSVVRGDTDFDELPVFQGYNRRVS